MGLPPALLRQVLGRYKTLGPTEHAGQGGAPWLGGAALPACPPQVAEDSDGNSDILSV